MKLFKQFSLSLLALAAATAASANTSQSFNATTATVNVDTAYLSANGYTVSALGSSTYDSSTGMATDPVTGVAIDGTASTGPITVSFDGNSGVAITKGLTTAKLTNFSFDTANDTLYGNLSVGFLLNLPNQALLTATNVAGDFGGSALNNVGTSGSPRTLNLLASNFVLADGLKTLLSSNGVDPNSVSFVASIVQSVSVGSVTAAVPEPSTYALMGLGLVGIALARRRQAK
jgi:hypothetical protein